MKNNVMPIQSSRRQRGSTLIESMVSLVILAIAVVGMLGVQVRTLMETNTAAGRTQAMLLINDLSERIKANPGGYQALSLYEFTDARTIGSTDCTGTACNAAALAEYDMDQWQGNFQATMPGAKVATFVSSDNSATTTGTRQLGVLIGWTMREKNPDDTSAYLASFITPTANVNTGITCWPGYICHLAYIEP